MAVLPPDPLFRFKSDLGQLHSLCFLEPPTQNRPNTKTVEENLGELSIYPAKQLLIATGEAGIVYFFNLENNRLHFKQEMGVSIQAVHAHANEVIIQEKEGTVSMFRPSPDNTKVYEKHTEVACLSGFCKTLQPPNHPGLLLIPQVNATIDVYSLPDKTTTKTLRFQGCGDLPTCLHDVMTPAKLGQMMCLEVGHLPAVKQQNNENSHLQQDIVFAGFETGDVFLWNLTTGALLAHAQFNECVISMTYDSVSARGVVGGAGDVLQVFAVDKLTYAMRPVCEISLTNAGCQAVKIRPDRKVLVVGGFDGRTRIYSWKTLRMLAALTENHACVTDVGFSRGVVPLWGSQIMAVCGADGVITLWNLYK